jgi:hypothetical protein
MRNLLMALALLALAPIAEAATITGSLKYKPHSLVRLKAEDVDAKSAMIWRVSPSKNVHRAASPRGVLEFAAAPGSYEVTLLVIRQNADGGLEVDEATVTVEMEGCQHDDSPIKPAPGDKGKLDPAKAISRIRFGNAGCTAAPIGPRRSDGRWDVLTAAHCVSEVGQRGTMITQDGKSYAVRVVLLDKTSDVCWLVTEESIDGLAYANLAKANPAVGTKVWHAGYGIDRPGNREEGEVQAEEDNRGQIRFLLSVSSGDSGGPILTLDGNEVVGTVCCTMERGAKVSMWAGSARVAQRLRAGLASTQEAWAPTPMPLREPKPSNDKWEPVDLPLKKSDEPKTGNHR